MFQARAITLDASTCQATGMFWCKGCFISMPLHYDLALEVHARTSFTAA